MAHILKVDGTTESIKDTELATLQEAVGGYIQIVSIPSSDKIIVLDEEGKLKDKPVNKKATELYNNPYDVIVGDVIICDDNEIS